MKRQVTIEAGFYLEPIRFAAVSDTSACPDTLFVVFLQSSVCVCFFPPKLLLHLSQPLFQLGKNEAVVKQTDDDSRDVLLISCFCLPHRPYLVAAAVCHGKVRPWTLYPHYVAYLCYRVPNRSIHRPTRSCEFINRFLWKSAMKKFLIRLPTFGVFYCYKYH